METETKIDAVTIDSTPAILRINYDEAREKITSHVEKYRITVTRDTVSDAKKMATELNKYAKELDDRRKEAVARVSAPIKAADGQMRELVQICRDGRQLILDQVNRFDDETRAHASTLLAAAMAEAWDRFNVRDQYRRAKTDDLALLTSITAAGNLTAGAAREIETRAIKDKTLQDMVDRRLLELENRSYRAGLSAPLTRDHVAQYLEADDSTYQAQLERLLAAELEREKIAHERRQQQARMKPPEPATPATESASVPPSPSPETVSEQAQTPAPPADADQTPTQDRTVHVPPARPGHRVVVAVFSVQGPDTPAEKLVEGLTKRLQDAGFKSLDFVHVVD